MLTWTIVSYPAPSSLFTFGIVSALDEDAARQQVLNALALEGIDTTNIDPSEVGLIPWDTSMAATKLVWG